MGSVAWIGVEKGDRVVQGQTLVKLEDTIKAFKGIVSGDYDDLPENAFYMVGTIDDAVAKGKRLAAEAA